MESGQDFRHLGEQIGQSGRYPLELGHGVGGLGLCELVPAGVPLRRARRPGHDQPVGVGAGTILLHLNSIEHGYDISKLSCSYLVVLERRFVGAAAEIVGCPRIGIPVANSSPLGITDPASPASRRVN